MDTQPPATNEPTSSFYLVNPASVQPVPERHGFLSKFMKFADAPKSRTPLTVIDELRQGPPPDRMIGWIVTGVITVLAFFLRWVKLGFPSEIMFDEIYYARDAWSVWKFGYEGAWEGDDDAVKAMVALGDDSALNGSVAEWAVHPPVGKLLIGLGEHMFGLNSFGWRFMPLVFGTLLVFLTIRLGRRLSRSTLIGGMAGLFITVDGLSFVMSRIALLDIFEAVFILAGVACVVADRDYFRQKLADHIQTLPGGTLDGKPGPFIFRPWLIVSGLMFGLACGTKWNAVYPLAVFGILVVIWSVSARRLAGTRSAWPMSLVKDGIPAFISMVIVGVLIYLASWIPWLSTSGGYDRGWGAQNQDSWVVRHFGTALGSLWHWHVDTYDFHTGEYMATVTHVYSSNPWVWPFEGRTLGIYAQNGIAQGEQGCAASGADTCLRVITSLGTPLLWWAACLALIAGLVWWLAGMDWRFGVAVLGTCSTWVPWIFTGRGAMFSFYSITMIPFMAIGLAMALGVILGPRNGGQRRQSGAVIVGAIVALIVLDFAFIYPVLTAELMTRTQWQWRMWLPGWV